MTRVPSDPLASTVADPPAVRLLLDHDRNRQLLADALGERYAVSSGPPVDPGTASFDVCILDAPSFVSHCDTLEATKRDSRPAFLPYVFLTERDRVDRLPEDVWTLVDEVLGLPLVRPELAARLDNLLERRRYSLTLQRRKERSEERFRTLFDTAPDPIVVTSAEGVISAVNESFAETVDESPDDLVDRRVTDVGFTPTETVERVLLRVDDPPETANGDAVELSTDDDESLVTELNADVVTALGSASERIGIFRDVTDREQRETDLRRQNERLEEFAGTIAHDLRNPLNVARGRLQMARADGGSEHLDAVAGAHERMAELIEEILTLARQGKLVMDPAPVSLAGAAERAWGHVDTGAATLSVETDCEILADEGRLCECLENLFRNAVDHGGEAVSVRVGPIDSRDRRGFYVADDGPGIPDSEREDVFDAGYTDAEDGTGFGLSIVAQVAEGHGWEVSITDSDGGGARFELTDVGTVSVESEARE